MFPPRPAFQARGHTYSERAPFNITAHIIPGDIHAHPASILEQRTTANILLPIARMLFTVVFHSDFALRICKVEEESPSSAHVRLPGVVPDIDVRIDLRHRQAIGQQHQPQFTFSDRISVLPHQHHGSARIHSARRHSSLGFSNLLMRRMAQIAKITQRHPPLIAIPAHERIAQQHQRFQPRTTRVHQPRRIRRDARNTLKMHQPRGIAPIHAADARDPSASFLRIRDHDQLVMIQFIRHIDAQQFQCGAQRKNQRGSGARLKFTTTDQRLSLDT